MSLPPSTVKSQVSVHEDDWVSCLMDGALDDEAFDQVLARMNDDGQARAQWATYHLISDVLRAPGEPVGEVSSTLVLNLRERLQGVSFDEVVPVASPVQVQVARSASNDAVFRWRWVAGFASLAAVVAVSWGVVSREVPAPGPQLAQAAPPEQAAAPVMIRDPQLDELLAAHRQLGGNTALQHPSGFLRNATFEVPR